MSWKKLARNPTRKGGTAGGCAILAGCLLAGLLPLTAAVNPAPAPAPKIKAVDADNHTIILNRPGVITVVIGTSEDSQDAARRAGKAMYPFQGRPDFQLIVVVDLRGSIAAWVPSVVIDHMRRSLDGEAIELKPYYLANGNKQNPRHFCHVVPDFKGTVVPQLDWNGTPDQLHAIMFGADGRELEHWDVVDDMQKFQNDVRSAIQALAEANIAKAAAAKAKH
jgi:hypothetical protein